MTELASQLEAAMHQESRRIGYVPKRFVQMLNEQGAIVTAHQLLASDRCHDGFTRLWNLRRLVDSDFGTPFTKKPKPP